jgi:hypothetical protein
MPKAKAPRYKVNDLKAIYKRYITGDVSARVAVLAEAVIWYDGVIPHLIAKKPMDDSEKSLYSKANKAREYGRRGGTEEEQDSGYATCLRTYEKIFGSRIDGLPKADTYIDQYKKLKPKLDAKTTELALRYATVLDALNNSFKPLGIEFAVHKADPEHPRQFDGTNKILISTELGKALTEKARSEGLIATVFSEAVTALKAAALEKDATTGEFAYNFPKLIELVPLMLQAVLDYCYKVPRAKLFKQATPGATTPVTPKTHTPRQPGVRPPHVGGRRTADLPFMPGSSVGKAFEMAMKGTTWNELDTYLTSINCAPGRVHRHILAGEFRGFHWDVTNDASTGRVKITNLRKP